MKKLIHIVIILGLLLAIFPIAAAAHTEDDPLNIDLIAGQNEDAGDVLVWNDTENLYVQYKLHGNWCLLETHVAVGNTPANIPQTKKNNPIPGKFAYSEEYSNPPCVQNPDPYVIPLDWEPVYVLRGFGRKRHSQQERLSSPDEIIHPQFVSAAGGAKPLFSV